MKVTKQPVLSVSSGGKVLVDTTNLTPNVTPASTSTKKRKQQSLENKRPMKQIRKDGIFCDTPISTYQSLNADKSNIKNSSNIRHTLHCTSDSKSKHKHEFSIDDAEKEKSIEMMTSDSPCKEYWVLTAERRREALEETLNENRMLVEENVRLERTCEDLKTQVRELTEDNALMEEALKEAKEMANIVQSVIGESDPNKELVQVNNEAS